MRPRQDAAALKQMALEPPPGSNGFYQTPFVGNGSCKASIQTCPAIMANSYQKYLSSVPLAPGVQTTSPAPPGNWALSPGMQLSGTAEQISLGQALGVSPLANSHGPGDGERQWSKKSTDSSKAAKYGVTQRLPGATRPTNLRRPGRGTVKMTSAPAAALKLLTVPQPGAPTGKGEAPPSCRVIAQVQVQLEEPPRENYLNQNYVDPPIERSEYTHRSAELQISTGNSIDFDQSFMIPTPTGSILDTMPSTPEAVYSSFGFDGVRHMRQTASPSQMPVLRLSEVLPGQQAVPLMGPGHRLLQDPSQQYIMKPSVSRGTYSGSETTGSASVGGSMSFEGSRMMPGIEVDKRLLGTADLPSRGSALHAWQACKPCAFVFQEGCKNALECEFCHLCDAGERKRRKKERRQQKRDDEPVQQVAR
jgi:hypothetical protein